MSKPGQLQVPPPNLPSGNRKYFFIVFVRFILFDSVEFFSLFSGTKLVGSDNKFYGSSFISVNFNFYNRPL